MHCSIAQLVTVAVMAATLSSTSAQLPADAPSDATLVTNVQGDYHIAETIDDSIEGGFHEDSIVFTSNVGQYMAIIQNLNHSLGAVPGVDSLTISHAYIAGPDLWVATNGAVTVSRGSNRHARSTVRERRATGLKTVLGVFINDASTDPVQDFANAAALSTALFGAGHTVRDSWNACTNGELTMTPATGTAITDGMISITLAGDFTSGSQFSNLVNAVDAALTVTFQGTSPASLFDHIMMFHPGTSFSGTAFRPGQWSNYRGSAVGHVSTQMHELGHNIDLSHAGDLSDSTPTLQECEWSPFRAPHFAPYTPCCAPISALG
jgi:hypothetical protein